MAWQLSLVFLYMVASSPHKLYEGRDISIANAQQKNLLEYSSYTNKVWFVVLVHWVLGETLNKPLKWSNIIRHHEVLF